MKSKGRQLEDAYLKDLGAKAHKNSGAMAVKNDGSDSHFLYEIKTTQGKGFRLERDYWADVTKNARKRGLQPVMVVAFDNKKRLIEDIPTIVVIEYEHFKRLTEKE